MKIKSKFKDYYDGVNPLHVEEPLFLRQTQRFDLSYTHGVQVLDCPEGPLKELATYVAGASVKCVTYTNVAIFFCGRVYSGASVSAGSRAPADTEVLTERFYWKSGKEFNEILLDTRKSVNRSITASDVDSQIKRWSSEQGYKDQKLLDLQLKALAPIIVRYNGVCVTYLIVNPILKAYDFAKIVAPEQAWQELSMFFGTVVMPERNTAQVSDKDRHAQHGFDKHSFRRTAKELRGK